jgi:hypothetical protein
VPNAYFTPLDLAETFGNKRISAYLIDNGGRKSNNNYGSATLPRATVPRLI